MRFLFEDFGWDPIDGLLAPNGPLGDEGRADAMVSGPTPVAAWSERRRGSS
ncbi:MAG: hypothetical protein IH849_10870 [Acidobacteria bacterium]|nr:hypothetical protein [Acidobacteriota bacterium]